MPNMLFKCYLVKKINHNVGNYMVWGEAIFRDIEPPYFMKELKRCLLGLKYYTTESHDRDSFLEAISTRKMLNQIDCHMQEVLFCIEVTPKHPHHHYVMDCYNPSPASYLVGLDEKFQYL